MARALQPSIVVLEDCDLIAEDRSFGHGPQPLLFEVLDAMDGLDDDADVAFVLTTNRVEALEHALRSGPGGWTWRWRSARHRGAGAAGVHHSFGDALVVKGVIFSRRWRSCSRRGPRRPAFSEWSCRSGGHRAPWSGSCPPASANLGGPGGPAGRRDLVRATLVRLGGDGSRGAAGSWSSGGTEAGAPGRGRRGSGCRRDQAQLLLWMRLPPL